MALIDTYRNNVARKRDELAKLSADKARESGKIPSLSAKILSAQSAISRTKSASTVKSKLGEIERAQRVLAAIDKKLADLDKKIAAKGKELASEEKKVRQEAEHVEKKRVQEEQKRLQSINRSLQEHGHAQSQMAAEIERLKRVPERITVLFFATNPLDTNRLRIDAEVRSIQEMIRLSEHRDSITFETRWAVRPLDILQAINELKPDVVHFSGHGSNTGKLVLENPDGTSNFVSQEVIAQTFKPSSDKIRLVFFNACFSFEQAMAVTEYIDAAIGMTDSIGDEAARVFAAQFYSSLGFGHSLEKAFAQAKAALMLEGIDESDTPMLFLKDGLEAGDIYIVRPEGME